MADNEEETTEGEGCLTETGQELQAEQGNSETELEISINALTRSVGHSTLRIQGNIKGKPINVLVDSGSTHSFIVPRWAKEGMELLHTNPLSITVANGEKLYSTAKCK